MEFYHDTQYIDLVLDILENGVEKGDRTGTGTKSAFAREMRFDLSDGTIPLLTTKKMHTKSIIHEIIWYLSGDTNIKYLHDNGVRIWNEWADENGDLGPVYGKQWRRWPKVTGSKINYEVDPPRPEIEYEYIDQIADVIDKLRFNPNDRRMLVNSWNVGQLDDMALPPCHYAFQFWTNPRSWEDRFNELKQKVGEEEARSMFVAYNDIETAFSDYKISRGSLSCLLNQRSCDVGLGVPFNIAQYSILTHMVAQVTGWEAGEFIWRGGDVHVYNNHVDALREQLSRAICFPSPRLVLNPDVKEINDFKFEDFEIVGYQSHETLKMDVSV